jgi:hypothetical protein
MTLFALRVAVWTNIHNFPRQKIPVIEFFYPQIWSKKEDKERDREKELG